MDDDISDRQIAECGSMALENRRKGWKSRLRQDAPFGERDAVETAVAAALSKWNGRRSTQVFDQLKAGLGEWLLSGAEECWVVIGAGDFGVYDVCSSPESAARSAAEAGAPVTLLDLSADVDRARHRYSQVSLRAGRGLAGVTDLGTASGSITGSIR